ncbi:hypothetical protein ES707_15347 [subsurface metagenome]
MSLSIGTLHSSAGSGGGIMQPSATPTITCFSGSHSFQEFTTVLPVSSVTIHLLLIVEKATNNQNERNNTGNTYNFFIAKASIFALIKHIVNRLN